MLTFLPRLKADGHPSSFNSEASSSGVDNRRDDLDSLVEGLIHKFQNRPHCFHLGCPLGTPLPDEVVHWIVSQAAGCLYDTRLEGSRPNVVNDVRLTECRCDLSGANELHDIRHHLAYKEACLKLVKAYISLFKKLSQNGAVDKGTVDELMSIFMNLVQSSLLKHCHLDSELLLLCRSFFKLAKACLIIRIHSEQAEEGKKNLLEWFEVSVLYGVQLVLGLTILPSQRLSQIVLLEREQR